MNIFHSQHPDRCPLINPSENDSSDVHLNYCFYSGFPNNSCNLILSNDECSEVETTSEPIIPTNSTILNETVDFLSNTTELTFGKSLEEKEGLFYPVEEEKIFTKSKPRNSRNLSRKNVNLEYREKSEKPPHTYISLIAKAIQAQPSQKATLAEIYQYLRENYEFFRGKYTGWKNSIRHNLSIGGCFKKLPKISEGGSNNVNGKVGKGHQWIIGPELVFEGGRNTQRGQRRASLTSNMIISSPYSNAKPTKGHKKNKVKRDTTLPKSTTNENILAYSPENWFYDSNNITYSNDRSNYMLSGSIKNYSNGDSISTIAPNYLQIYGDNSNNYMNLKNDFENPLNLNPSINLSVNESQYGSSCSNDPPLIASTQLNPLLNRIPKLERDAQSNYIVSDSDAVNPTTNPEYSGTNIIYSNYPNYYWLDSTTTNYSDQICSTSEAYNFPNNIEFFASPNENNTENSMAIYPDSINNINLLTSGDIISTNNQLQIQNPHRYDVEWMV